MGKDVRVYVVDSGVQGSHVDFGGRVVNGHTVRAASVVPPAPPLSRAPPGPTTLYHSYIQQLYNSYKLYHSYTPHAS